MVDVQVHVSGMGFPAETGPVIDVEPGEPEPPKYKVH